MKNSNEFTLRHLVITVFALFSLYHVGKIIYHIFNCGFSNFLEHLGLITIFYLTVIVVFIFFILFFSAIFLFNWLIQMIINVK